MLEDKLKGEMLDLQHCQRFVKNVDIKASTGKNLKHKLLILLLVLIMSSEHPGSLQRGISLYIEV